MAMFRYLILSVVALCASTTLSAQKPEGAEITFSSSVIDLGTLSQDDDPQVLRLAYTNTGDLPLVVTEVQTSCACTTVQCDRKKVMPGERGSIVVTMDPAKAPDGTFYRVLKVYSTSRSGVKHVTLKAVIE
ncbi:MAG: DUF1573 domain-containing protein [Rikenellaceae bacterium]|nr:DUF1573 domain-containing protein [Rikenellaceae bacterium]